MEIQTVLPSNAQSQQTAMIEEMIRKSAKQANYMMQVKLRASHEAEKSNLREQLSSVKFHTERAMANEDANRTLSSMFGKFSLVQKIMQNMG